jgi:hypothetical protein
LAQHHVTFPNVSATFLLTERCADPLNMPEFYEQSTEFTWSVEPVVEVDSLLWSAFGPDNGLVAVAQDRIFFRGNHFLAQDTTVLLYDFSMTVGDTAYYDLLYLEDHAVVQSIDTLTISGQQRLRFLLNNDDVWVQGVGSLLGFFRPIQPVSLGCWFADLSFCGYYISDAGKPYTICTDFVLTQDEPPLDRVLISAGPSVGDFVVRGTRSGTRFMIFDARGALVQTGHFSEAITRVHLGVPPGLYMLRWPTGVAKLLVE